MIYGCAMAAGKGEELKPSHCKGKAGPAANTSPMADAEARAKTPL